MEFKERKIFWKLEFEQIVVSYLMLTRNVVTFLMLIVLSCRAAKDTTDTTGRATMSSIVEWMIWSFFPKSQRIP